ncbi:exodeoxyribonuclease III [Bdellovibrionota bacterium FG-1]
MAILWGYDMRLLSWNVNGIRAASRNGFAQWFESQNADIIAVQETKARPEQLEEAVLHPLGYHSFWHSAEKPGYSGVGIFSRREPLRVQVGIGIPEIDLEGRVLLAEYPELNFVNAYFPNSQREHARLGYKLEFCKQMSRFLEGLRQTGKPVVICGDFNIAHREIDLKNPKANENNAGFLPEERAWMSDFLGEGYVDAFRHFEKGGGHYTWWSYRPGVREKNIGWRLDYFCVNQEHQDRLKSVVHQSEVKGSDHCPVALTLRD